MTIWFMRTMHLSFMRTTHPEHHLMNGVTIAPAPGRRRRVNWIGPRCLEIPRYSNEYRRRGGDHLIALSTCLLDATGLTTGKLKLVFSEQDVAASIGEAIEFGLPSFHHRRSPLISTVRAGIDGYRPLAQRAQKSGLPSLAASSRRIRGHLHALGLEHGQGVTFRIQIPGRDARH
jgi:hypothetical protein